MRLFFSFFAALLCGISGIPLNAAAKGGHLDFISNGHQWPAQVHYKADLPGGAVFLTNTGFTYSYYSLTDLTRIHDLGEEHGGAGTDVAGEIVHCHAYNVRFEGCNTSAPVVPKSKTPNYYNYFLGNNQAKWTGGASAYEEVDYTDLYRGINLNVYSKEDAFKYDFVVAPGADASVIQLSFDGISPTLTANGDLLIKTSVNELLEKAPFAYQMTGGVQHAVACRYSLKNGRLGFSFPAGYDKTKQLIIDPVLVFATYSGGSCVTFGWSATYDVSGSHYTAGECFGTGWPAVTGAFQTTFGGAVDVGINKYNSTGTTLLYSTYYGGDSIDYPNAIIVNSVGQLVIAGATQSGNLAVTSGCYDNSFNGAADVYIAHFNAAGTALVGATYLGGSGNEGSVSTSVGREVNSGEVLTDSSGNIYVAFSTSSANFPTTSGAYQTALSGTMDGFVTKMDSSCSHLIFSTLLGGSAVDAAIALQFGTGGSIIVGGGTTSTNFPGTSGGWQSALQGGTDGYIAILNSTGSSVLHASYIGTASNDNVMKLQLDPSGNVYAMGISAGGAFPVSSGVYNTANGRIYMAELSATLGSRMLSTTIASNNNQMSPSAFMLDVCGHLYFVGYGAGSGLDLTGNAYRSTPGGFWMSVLNANMASLAYASYFGEPGDHIDGGSSRLDPSGIVYHAICTPSTIQPTSPSVWSPTKHSPGYDIASWKFDFEQMGVTARFGIGPQDTFCAPAMVTVTNTSYNAQSYLWVFGDGTTDTQAAPPPHTFLNPGTYRIRLYAYNPNSCIPVDSAFHTIYVFDRAQVKLYPPQPLTICMHDTAWMSVKPYWKVTIVPAIAIGYQPGDTTIAFFPDSTTAYLVVASNSSPCNKSEDSIRFVIKRDTKIAGHLAAFPDKVLCKGDTAVYSLGNKMDRLYITPPGYYSLDPDSLTIRFYPPVTTHYEIVGIRANACVSIRDTQRFNITRSAVHAEFTLDPKLTNQDNHLLQLTNLSANATAYKWSLNGNFWTAEKSPSYTAPDTGYYCFTLVAADEYACLDSASDCAHVIETHISMPTAFTPNGDSKNDVFRPIQHNIEVMEFSVFNRYGQRVFVCHDNTQGWDGTFGGRPCDVGTYFYFVRYRIMKNIEILKGDVTLLR